MERFADFPAVKRYENNCCYTYIHIFMVSLVNMTYQVKLVLASAMWNRPHVIILDEPTNYLDREALGALVGHHTYIHTYKHTYIHFDYIN